MFGRNNDTLDSLCWEDSVAIARMDIFQRSDRHTRHSIKVLTHLRRRRDHGSSKMELVQG